MGQYRHPSGDAESPSAFRLVEKRYQRHWQQELRYRRGKLRGGKISPIETDFSAVLDFLDRSTWQSSAVLAAYSKDLHTEVFGLADHPGFYVIPGAVSPDVHRQLIVTALEDYPESPCNTNHTRAHGHLRGLWNAAQLGLFLRPSEDPATVPTAPIGDTGPHAACTCPNRPQAAQEEIARCTASHRRAAAGMEASSSETSASACSHNSDQEAPTGTQAVRERSCQQTRGGSQQDSSEKMKAGAWGELGGQLQWEPGGAGPPAAQLLRKLRWVTLGPQFNWTTRIYDARAPHRPLPPELRALAVNFTTAVAKLVLQPPSENCAARSDCDSKSLAPSKGFGRVLQSNTVAPCSEEVDAHADTDKGQGRAAQMAACGEGRGVEEWGDWEPDVALVNYYREGDTLGGHRDDAERNTRAPIVALSLGCDAIFLLGGETRDEQPVAVRIRGGDAVVMAGHARQCYHGVPRVFRGTSNACWPAEDGSAEAERLRPFAQHMQDCRINISIRCSR